MELYLYQPARGRVDQQLRLPALYLHGFGNRDGRLHRHGDRHGRHHLLGDAQRVRNWVEAQAEQQADIRKLLQRLASEPEQR